AGQIREIDARNPQLASRLSGVFGIWRKLDAARQTLVRGHLDALLAGALSPDVRETLSRIRGEG
ncbi:aminopeptidase N C-terminal domain-containing protein, partial [Acinetobacter baumannii]